ncbi:MAG: ribosome small subunit-dependent GTPase A [Bacteroidaceae bacterium]|nr:ribosome small subunit-dependent GTPase A [Bacteroidaceae bacterium]
MEGLVIKNTGSWVDVRTGEGEVVQCKVKGTFRLKGIRSTSPVVVGDYVTFERNREGTAFINGICDRRNYIVRKSINLSKQSHILAANIDICLLVVTLREPVTSVVFIDRFLATAEAYSIPVAIIINKVDLLSAEEMEEAERLAQLYQAIGYETLLASVTERRGLEMLPAMLKDKTALLAGNSGVGKSEMLNMLVPGARAKTAPISEAHLSGMHTTTFSEMYDLPFGGRLIDIPGVKGFGTFNFEREEVSHFFREIFKVGRSCRFGNCMHLNEPGCAVVEAVERGEIARSRYNSYLNMLDDEDESKYREGY